MKSFVKALWSRTKTESGNRTLSHPRDLTAGDLIQLSDSFGLPPRLRDQMFKVLGVVTYQFEHEFSSSFSLEGRNNDHIDLTIDEEGGRATAAFSLAIDRSVVEQLFDLEAFAKIFDPDENAQLKPIATLEFGPWLGETYIQEACAESAYFYAKDCRPEGPSEYKGDGEPFEYYSLRSGDHGIEIEVYASGETDVSLTLYRPVDDIKELWPAKKE